MMRQFMLCGLVLLAMVKCGMGESGNLTCYTCSYLSAGKINLGEETCKTPSDTTETEKDCKFCSTYSVSALGAETVHRGCGNVNVCEVPGSSGVVDCCYTALCNNKSSSTALAAALPLLLMCVAAAIWRA